MHNPAGILLYIAYASVALLSACRDDPIPRETRLDDRRDDIGRLVRLENIPDRIVSLAPSITEILFSIGADPQVVGVTSYCDYPKEARLKTGIGTMLQPDLETIVNLQSDLILMTVEGNREETLRRLENLGLTIYVMNPRSIEDILGGIETLGEMTGNEARAEHIADSLRELVAPSSDLQPDHSPSVLMLVSLEPMMTVGRASFMDGMIREAGGVNIASGLNGSYPMISREEVVRRDPDVILLPDELQVTQDELLRRYPEWKLTRAARNRQIFSVDADLLQRPGPRMFSGLGVLRDLFRRAGAPTR